MTLEPDTLTIVAPLIAGSEDATRALIRNQMDQGWVAEDYRLKVPVPPLVLDPEDSGDRQDAFDFKALPALHCSAFVVVPGGSTPSFIPFCKDRELQPCLIFEATFDGPRADFLWDLVDTNGDTLCEILQHCVGFPAHAMAHPDLLVDFLKRRSVRHNTYFSGAPGRTISEIRSEFDLREFLSEELKTTYYSVDAAGKPGPRPDARLRDIQRKLRNKVRKRDALNLAEERPSDPVSVRFGKQIAVATGGVATAVFGALALCLLSMAGFDVTSLWQDTHVYLLGPTQPAFGWIFGLSLAWVFMRVLTRVLAPETRRRVDRGIYYLLREVTQLSTLLLKLAITALAFGLAIVNTSVPNQINALSTGAEMIFWCCASAGLLVILFLAIHWRAAPLRHAENGPHVSFAAQGAKADSLLRVDLCNMLRFLCLLALFVPGLKIVDLLFQHAGLRIIGLLEWLLVAASGLVILAGLGFSLILCVKNALLVIAHVLQKVEDTGVFASATRLSERVQGRDAIWAREEHRTHQDQNHFASVTLVKSLPRMILLRLALTLINFVARFMDNTGKLGGISTIFSARWVLLDGGHRLVFLTNYVGAWDSYLGEFSDLNAYIGVNAIWTNTYLPPDTAPRTALPAGSRGIGFPTSSLMLFGGAAHEHPFKAYVRQSQVETLAWYGAYPKMSVPNINDNSRIRKDLFRTLSTDELDALFRRI